MDSITGCETSSAVRSISSNGPSLKPAWSRRIRSTVVKSVTPSPTMRRASVPKPRPAWLTMKPGVSCACTGVWPISRADRDSASHTAGEVLSPAMTSTTFISGTGLKKWNPAKRCGTRNPAAIAVTDRDDVLVANTASGPTIDSSSAKRLFFTSSRSTIASTTRVQSARSESCVAFFSRALLAVRAPSVSRPFSCILSHWPVIELTASDTASARVSNSLTTLPACAAICAMPRPMAPAPMMPTTGNVT